MEIKIDLPLGQIPELNSQDQEQKQEKGLEQEQEQELEQKGVNLNDQKQEPELESNQEPKKSKSSKNKIKGLATKVPLWTELEDLAFLNALKKRNYGDWKSIADEIKTRNEGQVKNRAVGKAKNMNTALVELLSQKKQKFDKKKNVIRVNSAKKDQNNGTITITKPQGNNVTINKKIEIVSKSEIEKKSVPIPIVSRQFWTEAEDLAFMDALERYEYGDWKNIAPFIKTKTLAQIIYRGTRYKYRDSNAAINILLAKNHEICLNNLEEKKISISKKKIEKIEEKKVVKKSEVKIPKKPKRDYIKITTATLLPTRLSARTRNSQLKEKEKELETRQTEEILEKNMISSTITNDKDTISEEVNEDDKDLSTNNIENHNCIDEGKVVEIHTSKEQQDISDLESKEIVRDETTTSDEQNTEHKNLIINNVIEEIITDDSASINNQDEITTPVFVHPIETEAIQKDEEILAEILRARAPELIESETPIDSIEYPDEEKEPIDDTKLMEFDNTPVITTIQEIALETIAETITENSITDSGVFENIHEADGKETESTISPIDYSEETKSLEFIIPTLTKEVEEENIKARIKETIPTKSPTKKSNSSTPASTPIKRTYTRRKAPLKSPVNTNISEEVSIMDSSSGSEKSSINIMSSSESGEMVSSVSSRSSRRSSLSSIKSTSPKISKSSVKSSKSSSISAKFKNYNDSFASLIQIEVTSPFDLNSVQEWEKLACPVIFNNSALLNAEAKFIVLRKRIVGYFRRNQNASVEDCVKLLRQSFSSISIEQTIKILIAADVLKPFGESENNFIVTEKDTENVSVSLVNGTEPAKKRKYTKSQKTNGPIRSEKYNEYKSQDENDEDDDESSVEDDLKILKKLSSISSGRKRKIRTDEGDWIDPNEFEGRVISHEDPKGTPTRTKRKMRISPQKEKDETFSNTEDPFRLILLNDFLNEETEKITSKNSINHSHNISDNNEDTDEALRAPFRVEMCTSVILLMDLHAHLHSSEIIGLLGGRFIKNSNDSEGNFSGEDVLKINYGYPCATAHSTGTQVDVDPLSEMEAGEYFESKGVHMTGWYHSHPNFEPNPSLRDLETQTMYQGLFKNSQPDSDIEPFVGVIVNPYMAITESCSHVECFYLVPNSDESQERLPYRLPIQKSPFNPADFPELLQKMREIVIRAESSPDRLNMQKNAQPGQKRMGKLMSSLRVHGNLDDEQVEQIRQLFN